MRYIWFVYKKANPPKGCDATLRVYLRYAMITHRIHQWLQPLAADFRRVPGMGESLRLLSLTALGILGNHFNIELFFGVHFIFGGVASLLAVRMSGVLWGTLAGVAVGSYTFVIWHHPYALVVFGLETLVVGGFLRIRRDSLILADACYWLLIGMPLAWVFYTYPLGLPDMSVKLIMLKQAVNGLVNAVIARLILQFVPLGVAGPGRSGERRNARWSLREALKLVFALFALFPVLIAMVASNPNRLDDIRADMRTRAARRAAAVSEDLFSVIRTRASTLAAIIAADPELGGEGGLVRTLLADGRMTALAPGLKYLEIIDRDGGVRAADPRHAHNAGAYAGLTALAAADGIAFSDFYTDADPPIPHFDVVFPVGQENLFAAACLTPELFSADLNRIAIGRDRHVRILDGNGAVIADTPGFPDMAAYREGPPANHLVPRTSTSAMDRWVRTYWRETVSIRPHGRWRVTVLLPMRDAILALQADHVRHLSVMFVIAVAALVLSTWAGRWMGRPIAELTDVAARLADDVPPADIRWPRTAISEIATLTGGFRRLIEDTVRKQEELERAAAELERRVALRTDELSAALAETERGRDRIDGILRSVGDGIIVTDLENRVLLMNPAAERLLSCRPGSSLSDCREICILEKTLRDKIDKAMARDMTTYEFDFEPAPSPGGRPRIMRGRTSLMRDRRGVLMGVVTSFNDVTVEREVDRMKTEFLSTAAHELRTPLTSIQGFSEILLSGRALDPDEERKFLAYINRQAVKLGGLINDLLDLSRIEAGKGFAVKFEERVVEDVIRRTAEECADASGKHVVRVDLPDAGTVLRMDRDKIEQVFQNLLSNAIKFSPDGGAIEIRGRRSGDQYEVRVRDRGIGMTPVQIEKIFDKFYRADGADSGLGGTGLGMAIVKHIIEAHGGGVWVESQPDAGTAVWISLPIQTAAPALKERKPDEDHTDRG